MIYCQNCGTKNEATNKFCIECGYSLINFYQTNNVNTIPTAHNIMFLEHKSYNDVISYDKNLGKAQFMGSGNNPNERVIMPPKAAELQQQVFIGSNTNEIKGVAQINIDYQIYCPVCGFILGNNPEHCPNCGKRFNNFDMPLVKEVDRLNNIHTILDYKHDNIPENELDFDNDGVADQLQREQSINKFRSMKEEAVEEKKEKKKLF